jgi:hypothetical protein
MSRSIRYIAAAVVRSDDLLGVGAKGIGVERD